MSTIITEQIKIERITSMSRAFSLLHAAFFLIPLVAGIDKFCNILTNWSQYLAPSIAKTVSSFMSVSIFMKLGGLAEIATACVVAFRPRVGGYLVAVWMWCIILNLLMFPGYYDIALRDLGLSIGALALAFLSEERLPKKEKNYYA